MNQRLWTFVLGASLTLAACSSSNPNRPAPGAPSPGAGAPPVAPNPNPAPPAPVVTPVTPVPTVAPAAAMPEMTAAPATAAVPASYRPYQDILKLKQAGLTDEFILNKVRTDNIPYQLTTSEIVELRNAGLSENVLQAMMRSGLPPATASGTEVARKAEFSGLARVGKGFLVFGTSAKKTGRLVVDGENISWFDSEDPKKNFSIYARSIKEVFNTCLLRPGQNLCLELGS